MKKLIVLCALALITGCSSSRDLIYGSSSDSIAVVEWNKETGTLTEIQKDKTGISAGCIGYSPKHKMIYLATGRFPTDGSPNGRLYKITKDGKAKLRSKYYFPHGYSYFEVDRSGNFLIGASYGSGHIDVFKLDDEGVPHHTDTAFEGKNTAHAVLLSPNNKSVYIPFVKQNNSLHQYSFDSDKGKLSPLNPAQAKVHPTAGPRHLRLHPTKAIVYASNEQAIGISVYFLNDDGTLTFKQICPANDTVAGPGLSASSLVVTPDGKYVFSAQRGRDAAQNFIHTYKVLEDGTLKAAGKTACDHIPWMLRLSSDGTHLLVSATNSGTLTAYSIQNDGSLKKKAQTGWGKNFRDMVVVEQ